MVRVPALEPVQSKKQMPQSLPGATSVFIFQFISLQFHDRISQYSAPLVSCRISRGERRKRRFQPTPAFPSLRLKISPGWTPRGCLKRPIHASPCYQREGEAGFPSAQRCRWSSACRVWMVGVKIRAALSCASPG